MRGHKHTAGQAGAEEISFGPFRLTSAPLQLWRGRRKIKLQPRPLAVLHYLVEHAESVVSREELLQAVWRRTIVTPAALQVCVRAIRAILGDEVKTPRYIETVGRDGYRFIAPLSTTQRVASRQLATDRTNKVEEIMSQQLATRLVGRESELARLHSLLEKALAGERQLVFLTGEAGIGKTTLIDAFLQQVQEVRGRRLETGLSSPQVSSLRPLASGPWIGRGQCLEHYGDGEAYLPVLEAVGQLCQEPEGAAFLATLRRYAPTWLLHLPGVTEPEEQTVLRRQGAEATQGQMLREMAEALEAGSATRLVIVVLEDLHVSDPSTVELLAYLAQRRARARLLLLGTYRPVEVVVSDHPLRGRIHELVARGYGQSLALELWTEAEVEIYLHRRLDTVALPATLASQIWRRTDGNPLFVVSTVDYLLQQGRLIAEREQWRLEGDLTSSGVPETLQHLIAKQLDGLSRDQHQVLEAASAAGALFTTASIAAGLQTTVEVIDGVCEELARQGQFIATQGLAEWPDGTVSGQYGFRHALYQEALDRRLGAGQRARLHRLIGERLETGYGAQAREMAAELAMHFTRGRTYEKAVQYYQQAGENTLQRSAYREAALQISKGLAVLETLPQTAARSSHQLNLQTMLVPALMAIKGHASREVEAAYLQARALCEQVGDDERLFPVLLGLFRVYNTRGEYHKAHEYGKACLILATTKQNVTLLLGARYALGLNAFYRGELAEAQTQTEHGQAVYDPQQHQLYTLQHGFNPYISCLVYGAATLGLRGYPDQARDQTEQALQLALELGHPYTLVVAHILAAVCFQLLRQEQAVFLQAEAGVAVATKHGFPFWVTPGAFLLGWSQVSQGKVEEGIRHMHTSLLSMQELGAPIHRAHFLTLLAEAVGHSGDKVQGLQLLNEALAEAVAGGEHFYEAEIYRLKGELLLAQAGKRQREKGKKD